MKVKKDTSLFKFFILSSIVLLVNGHYDELSRKLQRAGPQYVQTQGKPWPKPQLLTNYDTGYVVVRQPLFRFELVRNTCDMLEDALKRYYSIIINSNSVKIAPVIKRGRNSRRRNARHEHSGNTTQGSTTGYNSFSSKSWKNSKDFHGYLDILNIDLIGACESYPHDQMDESYEIKIDTPDFPGEGLLTASSNWGILRGLETFSQLLYPTEDFTGLQLRSTLVVDYPRFSYRSVLLDTSRHYLSKKVLLQNLDLMAMNKYNVFHWHIVDDPSFPYQSKSFPSLSEKGAYHAYTHIYTQKDIAEIIEYGRVRGIRVVPEFDSPGHTQSWGVGQPGLLTECYKDGKPDGTFGPIDPTREENYEFLRTLFQEVSNVFPDKYIHLGGDEVDFSCWKTSPRIKDFMQSQNFTAYEQVEEYYMQQLVNIVQSFPKNNSYIVWQEVIDNGVNVNKNTIVHIWKGNPVTQQKELETVTSLGYRALLSSCWYLNYISYGVDWEKYYHCDPQVFPGTDAQKRLVMGGGPAMWGEYVDSTNLISRLWPRAAVPAERLWSNALVNESREAAPRLEEHRCRLLKRGFQVEPPNGPGYCLVSWD